jgi:hypothetical protein
MRITPRRVNYLNLLSNYGAQGRNRTTDTAIFSRMLYQLSYLGVREARRRKTGRFIGSAEALVHRRGAD